MGRGSYLGGSTVIRAGSNWFSKPKSPKTLTEAQRIENELQKAQRKKAAEREARAKRAEKGRKLKEEAERRKTDPKYIALRAERRRKDDERMKKIVVGVKRSRLKLRHRDE